MKHVSDLIQSLALLLPLGILGCGQVRPGPRAQELGAKAEQQAGRLVQKVTGALRRESFTLNPHASLEGAGLQGTRALRLKEPSGVNGITVYVVGERALALARDPSRRMSSRVLAWTWWILLAVAFAMISASDDAPTGIVPGRAGCRFQAGRSRPG